MNKRNIVVAAIMFFAKVLGPVVGLLIGGQLNKIFYNFNRKSTKFSTIRLFCKYLKYSSAPGSSISERKSGICTDSVVHRIHYRLGQAE